MKCNKCSNNVEAARVEFGMKTCKTCAFSGSDVARYRGNMVYDHKTSPSIQIMSAQCWDEQKKYYKPMGGNTRSAVKNFSRSLCS